MDDKELCYEELVDRYEKLQASVTMLIEHTGALAESYEKINKEFVRIIFEHHHAASHEGFSLSDYEHSFDLMYTGLQRQVQCIQCLREIINLIVITKPATA